MPKPRKQLVSLDATPYYHCTSRCVRRAFLCGQDDVTGQCFEHRRQWIEDRILSLGQIFAIDICAYAVMSNHYHLVLHINKAKALHWSDLEVCARWHSLYKGSLLTQKFLTQQPLDKVEERVVLDKTAKWRLQLCDISWFMRALNEPIARQSNEEDKCTGKFWEARFSSQALLDEKAVAACMAYVDLNPIRAKMAESPETSDHTSIQQRILARAIHPENQPESLCQLVGDPREPMPTGLPFKLDDYLELVDWTGRMIREDKRGAISNQLPPILNRLGIDPQQWLILTTKFESRLKGLVGCILKLKQAAITLGFKRTPGLANCKALLH